jgi:DNA-binding transcriptional LysR family regulator
LVQLRVIPSAVPRLETLRADECQLVISPRPPDGTDILQKRLFETAYRVFFDASQRAAPKTQEEYQAADHATVAYEAHRGLDIDRQFEAQGLVRRFAVVVPGFSALPAFVRGTPLLVTAPALLAHSTFAGLAHAPVPVACPAMPMYLIWHARYQQDPAHRWLREQLEAVVAPALSSPKGSGTIR